jgi:hypothetical protein
MPARSARRGAWRADQISRHPGGLINETFVIRDGDGAAIAALQRLHPIWRPGANGKCT